MGLLCNNYWELKKNILDLMRRYMDLHPTNQWRIKPMKASLLLFRNREEKTENTQSIPSKCDSLGV
jgi:hypothetical protein